MIPFFGVDREYKESLWQYLPRIAEVLSSGQVLQGQAVEELETKIAERVGRKYAAAVGSGTDALFFALKALGIGYGDEVLVPDFSFVASASCILRAGAIPVFLGVDCMGHIVPDSRAVTTRTRAILAVHLFGNMYPVKEIRDFATEQSLPVIEDAAQAFGCRQGGILAGAAGDISCFSFDPTKVLGAPGSGGMVLSDSSLVIDRVKQYRYHYSLHYHDVGYNSQMSTLVAAVLLAKLEKFTNQRRLDIAVLYHSLLPGDVINLNDGITVRNGHKYVVQASERDHLKEFLSTKGIETKVHYPYTLHSLPMFTARARSYGDLVMSNFLSRNLLSLPIYDHLTDSEVEQVANAVKEFYQ